MYDWKRVGNNAMWAVFRFDQQVGAIARNKTEGIFGWSAGTSENTCSSGCEDSFALAKEVVEYELERLFENEYAL